MLGRGKALVFAVITAGLAVGGCNGNDSWAEAMPEGQGYRWVGSGDQGNFGSAYSFCRSTLGADTEGQRLEAASGPVIGTPGGPTTIPGYNRSTQSTRSDTASRRQFRGCMESQGWALDTGAQQQPAPPKL